jgi:hypothetical protein
MALADVQATLSRPETAAIHHEVGALLRRLHEIKLDAFGCVGAASSTSETQSAPIRSSTWRRRPPRGDPGAAARLGCTAT